jgi:hypothetical protein
MEHGVILWEVKVWRKSGRTIIHSHCTHPHGRSCSSKLSPNLIKNYAKKADAGVEVLLHINITNALEEGE